MLLHLETDLSYNPGDHLGVLPKNRLEIVDNIIERLEGVTDADQIVQLQMLKENHTPNGKS